MRNHGCWARALFLCCTLCFAIRRTVVASDFDAIDLNWWDSRTEGWQARFSSRNELFSESSCDLTFFFLFPLLVTPSHFFPLFRAGIQLSKRGRAVYLV